MSSYPNMDEQMSQKRDEQMSDGQLYFCTTLKDLFQLTILLVLLKSQDIKMCMKIIKFCHLMSVRKK